MLIVAVVIGLVCKQRFKLDEIGPKDTEKNLNGLLKFTEFKLDSERGKFSPRSFKLKMKT
jgi:hypothetical protein